MSIAPVGSSAGSGLLIREHVLLFKVAASATLDFSGMITSIILTDYKLGRSRGRFS